MTRCPRLWFSNRDGASPRVLGLGPWKVVGEVLVEVVFGDLDYVASSVPKHDVIAFTNDLEADHFEATSSPMGDVLHFFLLARLAFFRAVA